MIILEPKFKVGELVANISGKIMTIREVDWGSYSETWEYFTSDSYYEEHELRRVTSLDRELK